MKITSRGVGLVFVLTIVVGEVGVVRVVGMVGVVIGGILILPLRMLVQRHNFATFSK